MALAKGALSTRCSARGGPDSAEEPQAQHRRAALRGTRSDNRDLKLKHN